MLSCLRVAFKRTIYIFMKFTYNKDLNPSRADKDVCVYRFCSRVAIRESRAATEKDLRCDDSKPRLT